MPKHYRPSGKKKEGNAAKYVTRSQAVKLLQVSLPVFRKLCILKGIFPREPKKKVKGNHHTYYHLKDVHFLLHEPLLETFRDLRAYDKKIKKAKAKRNEERAKRLEDYRPNYKLDRLVKERYPNFVDAIRDLDDCLTMVHLFAALPALEREKVEVKRIHNCRRLSHEWLAYISRTHKLRKVFVSVKGIYYQAEVQAQKITWLTPHALQQVLSDDIDFNVMLTYLEFNETLLAFVNCHLYHSINVKYPPILDSRLESLAADLYALSRWFAASSSKASLADPSSSESKENKEASLEESELRLAQLQHQLPSNEPGALMNLVQDTEGDEEDDGDTKECKSLFKNMKFFLSREVPRESLLFVIPAFGGSVSWEGEGAPFDEVDDSITYQIVDRPSQTRRILSREYVQPQWVFDCVNARIILPTEAYMVGRVLPPHLSPFVDNDAEGYVPDYAETIKRFQAAAKNQVLPLPGVEQENLEDPQRLLAEGVIDRATANEAAEIKQKMLAYEKQYHDELKMEVDGIPDASRLSNDQSHMKDSEVNEDESVVNAKQAAEDMEKMAMVINSRKKKGLYEAIQIGKQRKQDKINLLKERKKKIKESQKSDSKYC